MTRQKVVNGVYYDLTAEEEAQMDADAEASDLKFDMIRAHRNAVLSGCDWTQIADSPLTDEKKAEWATYRQALRDYPAQSDRVSTLPAWPTEPS